MKPPSISKKPSKRHFLWSSGPDDDVKRFHEEYLVKWCNHCDFDFEKFTRVDHDRGEEPRTQYQCVFSYGEGSGDSFEMDGKEWDIGSERVPQTFIEIDDEGLMRVQGWETERIIDVEEFWHEGVELVVVPNDEDTKLRLDASELSDQ